LDLDRRLSVAGGSAAGLVRAPTVENAATEEM
jgi:hypothetical protein